MTLRTPTVARRVVGSMVVVAAIVLGAARPAASDDVVHDLPPNELDTLGNSSDRVVRTEADLPSDDGRGSDEGRLPLEVPYVDTGLLVRDIAVDPVRSVLYASTWGFDPVHPNAIVTLDPLSGTILAATPVAGGPAELGIAPDGNALYVGLDERRELQQLLLPAMAPGWSYDLRDFDTANYVVSDIQVAPDDPDLVVISVVPSHVYSGVGTIAFRNGVQLPNTIDGSVAKVGPLQFGSSSDVLIGTSTSNRYAYRFGLDADGLYPVGHQFWAASGVARFVVADDRLYSDEGTVHDLSTWPPSPLPAFEKPPLVTWFQEVAVEPDAGVASYLESGSRSTLWVYDLHSRQIREEWELPYGWSPSFWSDLVPIADGALAFVPYYTERHPDRDPLLLMYPGLLRGTNGEFTALTPNRVLDTRSGHGADGVAAPLGPGGLLDVQITGRGGVPATGVKAVVMNVTSVAPTESTYLSIYPTGITRPDISNLNNVPLRNRPNLVTVPVSPDGKVTVFNAFGSTDVLFDVAGYYAGHGGSPGSRVRAIDPVRLADSRHGTGGIGLGAFGPGEQRTITTTGTPGGAPPGASAVVLNITVTGATTGSYLTISPSDVERPDTSSLNYLAGDTVANQVIVRVPPDGRIDIFNAFGRADVIVDLVGYFELGGDQQRGRYLVTIPYRAFDTRSGSPFPPPGDLWDGDVLTWGTKFERLSAFVANVTVTQTSGSGFIVTYPHDGSTIGGSNPPPATSTVNYGPGETVANHAIIRTGPYLAFLNRLGKTHLIADVFGAFA